MKKTKLLSVAILFVISFQLHSQNTSLQIGFGMHQDVHLGHTITIDSILIEPYSIKDEFRPIGMIAFQKRFKENIQFEVGLSYSITYYGYIVSIYNPVFNSFPKKIGVRRSHTFTFPLNINVALTNKLYAKAGISVTLGILDPYQPIYFDNTPAINDIYNDMQNIFKPNSFNGGFGIGYEIWRFDIVYFKKIALTKMTKSISINNKQYEVFGSFYSNTFTVFYNFKLK